jgi:hypothetical protein
MGLRHLAVRHVDDYADRDADLRRPPRLRGKPMMQMVRHRTARMTFDLRQRSPPPWCSRHVAATQAAPESRISMQRRNRLSIKSATVAGLAASALLGLAGVTLSPEPAKAVVYCQYVNYPPSCVARAGVVLRPRPVARAAVRHNAGGNLNGGVNRVGVRR